MNTVNDVANCNRQRPVIDPRDVVASDRWLGGRTRTVMTPTEAQKRLVIVASTGMVVGYALRCALDHPAVGTVTAIGRKPTGLSHPKLHEVLHQDFANSSALTVALSGQDAAVFCLGAYTGAVADTELRRITVDYTIEFARVLRGASPHATFAFLSAGGADPTGQSRFAFARFKGEAEKALAAAGFPRVYIFRPAYICPVRPRREPNFSYRLLRAIYPAFRVLFPNQVIRADDLARTMVDVAVRDPGEGRTLVLENRDVRHLVGLVSALRGSPNSMLSRRTKLLAGTTSSKASSFPLSTSCEKASDPRRARTPAFLRGFPKILGRID